MGSSTRADYGLEVGGADLCENGHIAQGFGQEMQVGFLFPIVIVVHYYCRRRKV